MLWIKFNPALILQRSLLIKIFNMISIPHFNQIKSKQALREFSKTYLKASGLPIPDSYLYHSKNKIFGIYWKQEFIGGFILGNCPEFRTIDVFSEASYHQRIYAQMEQPTEYTEITCFWIKRKFRTNTTLNFFTWLAMSYALKKSDTKYFLFGTCSRSLARLYATTSKSILLHQDYINNKPTFIFWAKRSTCVLGILEILLFKTRRRFGLMKFELT